MTYVCRVTASLWMNFPTDKSCIGLDSQFMWGDAVMFSPVLVGMVPLRYRGKYFFAVLSVS